MARFDTTFDASGVEPLTGYELLPAGDYLAQIVESEMRPTRSGTGEYLWIGMDILEGQYQGRKVYDQLNLVNQNPTTVEMAQRTLSAICHATGELHVSDSEDLHFKPMTIRVSIRKPKDGGQERNQIRYLVPKDEPAARALDLVPATPVLDFLPLALRAIPRGPRKSLPAALHFVSALRVRVDRLRSHDRHRGRDGRGPRKPRE